MHDRQAGQSASQCIVYAIFAGVNQMGSKPWNEYREYMECLLVYSLFSYGQNCNHVIESTWFVIYTIAIGAWESGRSCTMQMQFFHYFDWQTSRRIQSRELVAINLWCAIIFVLINCVWLCMYGCDRFIGSFAFLFPSFAMYWTRNNHKNLDQRPNLFL